MVVQRECVTVALTTQEIIENVDAMFQNVTRKLAGALNREAALAAQAQKLTVWSSGGGASVAPVRTLGSTATKRHGSTGKSSWCACCSEPNARLRCLVKDIATRHTLNFTKVFLTTLPRDEQDDATQIHYKLRLL